MAVISRHDDRVVRYQRAGLFAKALIITDILNTSSGKAQFDQIL